MDEKLLEQKKLTDLVNKYAYQYYVLEKPIVSDYDYDKLYDRLLEMEKENNFVFEDSPTQRVGGEVLKGFKKVVHKNKLYSLNKCNDLSGLNKFISDVNSLFPNQKFVVEYKFDGLRIIAHYKDGRFVGASTRGNGLVGEDVSLQVKTIKSVPLAIDYKGELYVAGEGVITQQNLEKYNKTAEEKLKNARNAVAGAIRNLDPKITASRNLDVVFYDIISIEDQNLLSSQEEVNEFLKANKFLTGKLFETITNLEQAEKIINKVDQEKSKLDITIDGLVIKLNNLKLRDEIGFTAKFPKWAIAYKFAPQELTSRVKDVLWNVGRTGKVTPIAIVDPVELAGATVSRATLNNLDDIKRKNIKINSLVFIRRSNEVIPEILGLAQEGENALPIDVPNFCPSCHSKLVKVGPNLFCKNPDCEEKQIQKLSYFASRNCMNIEGLSTKILEVLCKNCGVKTFSDIYKLTEKDMLNLPGFKNKKIENILNSINKSKTCNLSNFLDALSIDGVGEKTSKDLAKKFRTLENVKNATLSKLLEVKDIGEIIANNIFEYFNNCVNLQQIQNLLDCGVKILELEEKAQNTQSPFYNKKVVLTGTLEKYKRNEATKIIEDLGGEVSSSVSKNTDYVLVGSDAGSKLEKARALNIKILLESDFDKLINI